MTTRRQFLTAAPLPIIAGVACTIPNGSTIEPHPDADLLAAWFGYVAARRACDTAYAANPGGRDEDFEPYYEAADRHEEVIRRHQASTVEGFAVQLRLLFAARMEFNSCFRAAIYGEPEDDDMTAELSHDIRDRMLWEMVQAATKASRIQLLPATA